MRGAGGSVGVLALLLAATPALADEIVVTGTRIESADPGSLEPIVIMPGDYLDDRALTNVADALNELPGYRGSITPAGSQSTFGQGVNFIGLYGLGTQRTLTLVDGHRVVSSNVPSAFVLSSGAGAFAWHFAPDGRLRQFDKGVIFGAPVPGPLAAGATASGGDGLALNDFVQITSGLKRLNVALFAGFDLSDHVTLFADGLFYHGQSDELVQQPTFNGVLFTGVSGPLTFRTDNPFLTDQARQQLAVLGYGSTFQLSRAHTDLADLTGRLDSKLYRIVAGARGKLGLGERDYAFEVSLNYGRNDLTDHGQTIDQQRFVNAVNVTSVGGQIVCSATPTVSGLPAGQVPVADPQCVPLNLFGNGAPSPAALAYILRNTTARTRLEQFVVNANLGGAPFKLFGNPVSFNFGIEHHRESAAFNPDPFVQAGLGARSPLPRRAAAMC